MSGGFRAHSPAWMLNQGISILVKVDGFQFSEITFLLKIETLLDFLPPQLVDYVKFPTILRKKLG